MKIDISSKISNDGAIKETVNIHIEFDPMNQEEERVATLITVLVDMMKKYDKLNNLAD
jgi:hypothetical protein